MHPDLRKIWIVASTEFGSAVHTKSFLVGLLLLPLIGLSMVSAILIVRRVDTRPRSVAVIDPTGELYPFLERAALAHNAQTVDPQGKAVGPRINLSSVTPSGNDNGATLLELSDRVRRGALDAFVVIPRETITIPPPGTLPAPGRNIIPIIPTTTLRGTGWPQPSITRFAPAVSGRPVSAKQQRID